MVYRKKEHDKYFKKYNVEPEIISDGDEYDNHYGTDFVLLTDKHIKAIQEGKALYVSINGGEYCCLLKKEEEEYDTEEEKLRKSWLQIFAILKEYGYDYLYEEDIARVAKVIRKEIGLDA